MLGGGGCWKSQHKLAVCAHSPENQWNSGLHPRQCAQQVEGAVLYSGETQPGALHPALVHPAEERHGYVGVSPEESQ